MSEQERRTEREREGEMEIERKKRAMLAGMFAVQFNNTSVFIYFFTGVVFDVDDVIVVVFIWMVSTNTRR